MTYLEEAPLPRSPIESAVRRDELSWDQSPAANAVTALTKSRRTLFFGGRRRGGELIGRALTPERIRAGTPPPQVHLTLRDSWRLLAHC